MVLALANRIALVMPQGDAQGNRHHECHLKHAHNAVAARPASGAAHLPGHDHGPTGGAESPAAVQPVHVARCEVRCHVGVKRRVHRSGTQTIRNGPEHELPELGGGRESKERDCGERHRERGELARSQPAHELHGQQARDDRAKADDHRDHARQRDVGADARMHGWPCRPKKAVR